MTNRLSRSIIIDRRRGKGLLRDDTFRKVFNMANLKSLISEIATEQETKPVQKKKLTPAEVFEADMELLIRLTELGRSDLYAEIVTNLLLNEDDLDRDLVIMCLREVLEATRGLDLTGKDEIATELCNKLRDQYSRLEIYVVTDLVWKNLGKAYVYSDREGIR